MRAAYASRFDDDDPLAALAVGERPEPDPPGRRLGDRGGAGQLAQPPRPVVAARGRAHRGPAADDPRLRRRRRRTRTATRWSSTRWSSTRATRAAFSILSEHFPGTLAERVAVPRANLVPQAGRHVSFDRRGVPADGLADRVPDADHQGPGRRRRRRCWCRAPAAAWPPRPSCSAGRSGKRVYATSRDAGKRERIAALGATAVEPGARLPERVDVVIETVGAATFDHSLKCGRAGGPDRGLRRDRRAPADGQPAPGVRHAAGDPRHHHGHARTSWPSCWRFAPTTGCGRWWTASSRSPASTDAFARLHSGDVFGKVVIDHTA